MRGGGTDAERILSSGGGAHKASEGSMDSTGTGLKTPMLPSGKENGFLPSTCALKAGERTNLKAMDLFIC